MRNQVMMDVHETTDMTLATALLCKEDVVLMATEPKGADHLGRPLCQFTLGHPATGYLEKLVHEHESEPDGLQVGAKLFDKKKATLIVPAIHAIRGTRQVR